MWIGIERDKVLQIFFFSYQFIQKMVEIPLNDMNS